MGQSISMSSHDAPSQDLCALIDQLQADAGDAAFNLAHEKDLQAAYAASDALYAAATKDASGAEACARLDALEQFACAAARKDSYALVVQLAIKLAKSKALVSTLDKPSHVTVTFAVYNEHNRVLPPEEHEHGEDFAVRKVRQLEWLCAGSQLSWSIIVVDDGCPNDSGALVEKVVSARLEPEAASKVRVLRLADAIEAGLAVAAGMDSPNDSRKGGSVQYGMWAAAAASGAEQHRPSEVTADNHVVVFTDADLSTHLGEVGLLVAPILQQGKLAAIASRREQESIVVRKASRNMRGKLFIYLWKRILPTLHYITDTQCGFKAWHAPVVEDVVLGTIEKKFAFDIELLLRTELRRQDSIQKVGVAWIDSDAESNTAGLTGPHLSMLKTMVLMYRKYLPATAVGDEFAAFIESLSEEQFGVLIQNLPAALADAEPSTFDKFSGVSVADLQEVIDSNSSKL